MAVFAFAIAPVALLFSGATPAGAAAASGNQPPATVAFTSMSPQWASPGTTIVVAGSVKNTAPVSERFVVQLLDSHTPTSSVAALEQGASGALYGVAGLPLPSATWSSGLLRPGASANWSVQVAVNAMGFTRFGVYPLAAQVYNLRGDPLNNTLTYLPYVPAGDSTYASSIPPAQKISWIWPLIDQPLLGGSWQKSWCTGSQAAALAQSLTSAGRLGQLLASAGATTGTAVPQAQSAQSGSARAAQRQAAEPRQGLAQTDAVTWAVDPALLVNVSALAQCGTAEPQWARTASTWLARLKTTTSSQPLFVTAYGDPNLPALIGAGKAADVENAFSYGRSLASQILGRDLTAPPTAASPASTAGLAWSASAPTSYDAAELAGKDNVGTLVVDSSAFPLTPSTTVQALNGIGGYTNMLLANDSITSLLGSAGTGPAAVFTTSQLFLAETALLAGQNPGEPIIVAPPQRWQPPAGLATALLADTASAPWLTPTNLTSLTGAPQVPTVQLPATGPDLTPLEQQQLGSLDDAVARLVALRAEPDPDLALAVSTVESSAYSSRFGDAALGMIATITDRLATQEHQVHIIAENRITLGGTRGSVPVSIDNRLGFPVRVILQLSYSTADGMRVSASPAGLTTVPARTAETVQLRITAAQTGSTTITMTLLNQANQPLASPPVRTTVQTTQVGLLGMTIFGAALGVFLLASAVRALRRGRPRSAPDAAHQPVPREDDQPGHSTEEAGPDTVVTGSTRTPPPWTPGNSGLPEAW